MDFSRLGRTGLLILELRHHAAAELSEFPGRVCSQGERLARADGQRFAPAAPGPCMAPLAAVLRRDLPPAPAPAEICMEGAVIPEHWGN